MFSYRTCRVAILLLVWALSIMDCAKDFRDYTGYDPVALIPDHMITPSLQFAMSSYDSAVTALFAKCQATTSSDAARDVTMWTDGAHIIDHLTSPSIRHHPPAWYHIFTPTVKVPVPPVAVLDPQLSCWAFDGFSGYITVQLSTNASITQLVVEHPSESTLSAPRDIVVWAITKPIRFQRGQIHSQLPASVRDTLREAKLSATLIHKLRFEIGSVGRSQAFNVPTHRGRKVDTVLFQIDNNWGGEYTCLWGLRVMGN